MLFRAIISWVGRIFSNMLKRTNYSHVGHMTVQLRHSVIKIFTIHPLHVKANFDEVVAQFHLTEADLIKRAHYFERLIGYWLIAFTLVFLYGFYLIIQGIWLGAISASMLALMILCQAFRYHFWLFQLKQRKLGCSFHEWFQAYLGKGKQ